jgi:transcriptional regulator with GAF, ATPase, and Fis domain
VWRRKGRFEQAHGGTLFLDEVGELSLATQAKLLRVLQEQELERVGGNEVIRVDVRVIAATHRNLHEMVAQRRFRADLLYRLSVFPIDVPPLRARRDDIPLLVDHMLRRAAERAQTPRRRIAPEVMNRLKAGDWPSNVRELQNAIERAAIVESGEFLAVMPAPPRPLATPVPLPPPRAPATRRERDDSLRREYQEALDACGWTIEGSLGAAARLGVPANTLRSRLKRLGLLRPSR